MSQPPPPSRPAAGWYGDPDTAGQERYWDSTQWTRRTRPARGPNHHLATALVVLLVLGLLAVVVLSDALK